MMILAVDSSATAASVALVEDGKVLAEFYSNTGLTHSQTLMPMLQGALQSAGVPLSRVDLLAVSAGPGSFTGIRIGVASIKGLAVAQDKPCVGVSTLAAMAENLRVVQGTVCAVMDARCGQVYNAVFSANGGVLQRLTPDRALSMDELARECEKREKPLFLVGDGAKLCYNKGGFQALGAVLPPEPLIYQRACGVARVAAQVYENGQAVSAAELMPVYLRPPQAERNLKSGALKSIQ